MHYCTLNNEKIVNPAASTNFVNLHFINPTRLSFKTLQALE